MLPLGRMPSRTRALTLLLAATLVVSLNGLPFVGADEPEAVDGFQQAYSGVRVAKDHRGFVESTPVDYEGEHLTVQATYIGRNAAEPTIGVTKEGVAFMSAGAFDALPIGVLARTEVMRSIDDGVTWEFVTHKLPVTETTLPPATFDPYVYVDEDTGRVFQPELGPLTCSWLNFSDDLGETWLSNPVACGDYVNDHQTIVTGPPPAPLTTVVYPNVVYYCFNRVIDSNCGRSLDGGLTFIPTATPAFLGFDPSAGGLCGGLHGHIRTDSEGRLFLPKGHCSRPWLGVSEDGGDTWRRVRVADIPTGDPHLAVATDDADNVYFLYWDSQQRLPFLSISRDHGLTWDDPIMVAPPGVREVNFPVMAAGAEGHIVIMFPGTMSENRSDNRRPWNSYQVVSTNALDEEPLFLSTTANPLDDPIHRGNCQGRCAGMYDFLDVIVSPHDGMFWSSITDTCTSNACIAGAAAAGQMAGVAVKQLTGPLLRPEPTDD